MKTICKNKYKMTENDLIAFYHYLLITPEEWAKNALNGLLNKAIKTIIDDYIEIYKKTHTTVPTDYNILLPALISLPEFKPYKKEATEKNKPDRKEPRNIEVWQNGFELEDWQYETIQAFCINIEIVLEDYMDNKIYRRRQAFKKEQESKFRNNKNIKEIPADEDSFISFVASQPEYKSRKQIENLNYEKQLLGEV